MSDQASFGSVQSVGWVAAEEDPREGRVNGGRGRGAHLSWDLRKKFCWGLFLGTPTAEVREDLLWEQLGPQPQPAAICPLEM